MSSIYNWLTRNSIWRLGAEVEASPSQSFAEKVKIGIKEGFTNLPRTILLTVLTTAALSQFLPPFALSSECQQMIHEVSKKEGPGYAGQIGQMCVKAISEEIVFRSILQNGLGKICSKTKAMVLSHAAFAAFHLNNLNDSCIPISIPLTQVAVLLLNGNLSLLYERAGLVSTVTSHIFNNLFPKTISLAFSALRS